LPLYEEPAPSHEQASYTNRQTKVY
jgi:hypothetical protein